MKPTENQVRGVGIIGAGRVSRDHVYAVKNKVGLHLVGISEPDQDRGSRFARLHQCQAYTDHRDLLAQEDVHLILAGVPHGLHASIVIDALNAGKHVMIEKPMALTLEECEAMIETAHKNGVQLMVGHTQHFFPANIATKALLDDGKIGDIVMATQTWYKPFGLAGRPPWLLDRATGGGMWLMNGAHMLDCLLWFIGSQVVAVKGFVTNKIMQQQADDSIMALLEFANGVYATVVHSGAKRPVQPPPEQWFTSEITGSEGMLKTIPYEGQVWLNTEGYYERIDPEPDQAKVQDITTFVHQIQTDTKPPQNKAIARSIVEEISGVAAEVGAFVQAIEMGAEAPISNAHARSVVEVLLAVEESSRTGREVRLR